MTAEAATNRHTDSADESTDIRPDPGRRRRALSAVRDIFKTVLAHTGVPTDQPVAHLALLYEGALATVAVGRDPQAVLLARDCALAVFDLAIGRSHPPKETKQ